VPVTAPTAVSAPVFILGWLGEDTPPEEEVPMVPMGEVFTSSAETAGAQPAAPQFEIASTPQPVLAPDSSSMNGLEVSVLQATTAPLADAVVSNPEVLDSGTLTAFAIVLAGGWQLNAKEIKAERRRPQPLLV
jgi:hypothetical protein